MMAGKRLPLPKARAAKALHPVEAIAEGASAEAPEGAASIASMEAPASRPSTESAASVESLGTVDVGASTATSDAPDSSMLVESSVEGTSSELLEIAEALESTAAIESITTPENEESVALAENVASKTSKKRPAAEALSVLSDHVDKTAVELLAKPPDAPTVGHYRRSFMLDPETLALIEELRWHLRCDKSEVVRRAVDLLARQVGLKEETH